MSPVPSIVIAWPSMGPPRSNRGARPWCLAVRRAAAAETRSRPATSAWSLATVRQRAVWLKPQSGTSVRRSGGDAGREHPIDPLGDVVRRLDVGVLDVDDPDRHVATRRCDLGDDLELGQLPVGELEDELVDPEPEHRRRGSAGRFAGASGRPRKFPKQRWAPSRARPTAGSIASLNERREVGPRLGVDRRRRLVDLDDRRARVDQARRARPGGGARTPPPPRPGRGYTSFGPDHEPPRQGVRPRQRHLERSPAPGRRRSGTRPRRPARPAPRSARSPRADAAGRGHRRPSRAAAAASRPRSGGGRTRP